MGFFAVRSILRISLYAASAAVTVAACTHAAEPTGQLIPPAELNALVAGRTLRVRATSDTPFETLLFLGSGRKGWLDNQVIPAKDPQPGDMSMVFDWRVEAGSRVCTWATPLIGEMPSFTPPFRECVQVLRSGTPPQGLSAVVEWRGRSKAGPLELLPFNAFPRAIDQYLEQVRVLYGGKVPDWSSDP